MLSLLDANCTASLGVRFRVVTALPELLRVVAAAFAFFFGVVAAGDSSSLRFDGISTRFFYTCVHVCAFADWLNGDFLKRVLRAEIMV